MERIPIHALTNDELAARARELLPRGYGHARRIHRRAMLEGRFAPADSGLGTEACAAWAASLSFELPKVTRVESDEGEQGTTSTMVVPLPDAFDVESVLIPMGPQPQSSCVSSQGG